MKLQIKRPNLFFYSGNVVSLGCILVIIDIYFYVYSMFHLWRILQLIFHITKMCEKRRWESSILRKDEGYWAVLLRQISLFHRCFLHILLTQISYLAFP